MQIITGDALETLKTIPDACCSTCVTSPPYYGLRDYGADGQIGNEPTPDKYTRQLVEVFREVRRVLKDDGTLWMLALKSVCPTNTIEVDETDLPSVLVYIPAFKNSDVLTGGNDSTHPAFIVNGVQIPGFYYSKYQNVVHAAINTEGYNVTAAYSLPGEDPAVNIDFDTSRARCEAKGHGWHLSTNAEWAAIALWCKKNGFMPYGNNNYGKDTRESNYKAIPTYKDSNGKTCRVATGTGPLTWSHDKTLGGIWDLNGNVWEWQGGIRFVWGELQILANNDAADPDNPQNETSVCWKAINAADGSLLCQSGGKPDRHTERPHVAHLHRGPVPAVLRLRAEAPPHNGAGLPGSRRTVGHIPASQSRARQRHDLPLIRLPRG